jgi:transcriptional regulator with XRE-family HTH domain
VKPTYRTLTAYLDEVETQAALAKRLRISQAAVSKAKYGCGSYALLKRISKATGVPLESFDRQDAA